MSTYSLQLLRHLLDHRPIGLPDDIQEEGEAAYKKILGNELGLDDIESALFAYGKKTWVYRQAENAFETGFASEKKEAFFRSFLSSDIKKKWEEFLSNGGDIHDFRHGEVFEEFFTPEENTLLEEAMVEADELVHEYLKRIAAEEAKEQYEKLLNQYREEQYTIEEKIKELRALIPEKGQQWDAELEEAARYFERGLADIEERPTVQKVQAKIDWYQGQVEAGNT
jgi:polyhydroxyalkanoate synthesis regulator phasin